MTKSLEQRIQRLEDIQDIINLKSRYLNTADGGWDRLSHDGDAMTQFLTEDCIWDGQAFNAAHGREALRQAFAQFREALPFAYHIVTNPIIEVDGDTARGEWHLQWIGTDAAGTEMHCAGIYTDEFTRTDDGWKLSNIFVRLAFWGPRSDGWINSMGLVKAESDDAKAAREASDA